MNYTHLGRTGLKVSRLCLGTMNFGDVTDEKTSARILDEALEAGISGYQIIRHHGDGTEEVVFDSRVSGTDLPTNWMNRPDW